MWWFLWPTSFWVSTGCLALCLYKKKASAESIPSVTIPTEIAMATFFVPFVGCVAVGFAVVVPLDDVEGADC